MHDPDIHILSTKQISEELLAKAAQHNIHVDVVPFIHIALSSPETFTNQLPVEKDGYVVFTSSNAVQAVARWQHATSAQWKVFCLDGATAKTVKSLLPRTSIIDTASYAAELADLIVLNEIPKLTFFCGNLRRDELPGRLKEKGIEVKEIEVYTTVLTSVKLPDEYRGILFFSPSAVESYLMENELHEGMVLFAIGNTTAAVLAACNNTLVVSEKPSTEELINKVIGHFQMTAKNR